MNYFDQKFVRTAFASDTHMLERLQSTDIQLSEGCVYTNFYSGTAAVLTTRTGKVLLSSIAVVNAPP